MLHAVAYRVPRAERRARIDEALQFVDLGDRRKDLTRTFSGGMKRRLEIARGLVHRPDILFLDEPTTGLDPQTRARTWEVLRGLRREVRHDAVPHHPLHGRGGELRPDRHRRPRPHRRAGHAGRAQAARWART